MKDEERRAHERVEVEMRVEETDGKATYFQRSGNLSLGGIFLESTLPHPEGTRVTLKLEPPGGGAPVEVAGEVVAPQKNEVGMRVKFVDLGDDAKKLIESVLEEQRERRRSRGGEDA